MWKLDLHKNNRWPKLDMYKFIKNDYCIEPHILYVKNKNYQRALTRLRLSAHKLNIEIGRHSGPYIPRHQRLCLYCNCGEIDDEIYFLLKCNFHTEARHSLFQLIASYLPLQEPINEVEIFTTVMTNKNPVILNALGKFVYQEFKRHEQEVRYNNA